MGRRSDHTRAEIRDMILAAAASIVEEGGLRRLSIRDISKRIGYSVGTVYNLFKSQDDLIVEMNGRTLDELYAALAGISSKRTPASSLEALAVTYLDFTGRQANRWNALFEHRLKPGTALPPWYDEKIKRLLALVEAPLEPLFGPRQEGRKLRAARILWCGIHGISSLANGGKLGVVTDQTVTDLTRTFVSTFLNGLKATATGIR
ncbi:MAG: TetR/AcrR family transcriptional regulator [Alphaproteobacteria bacterium]|nr:TetR/AcrR family transcriptional regulator [Alphaproteobacteria bacterium]